MEEHPGGAGSSEGGPALGRGQRGGAVGAAGPGAVVRCGEGGG